MTSTLPDASATGDQRASLTQRQIGFIEGYAAACDNLRYAVTGDRGSAKSYDPMTIRDGVMHSYAFDLKDGGRRHPLSDYRDTDEVCEWLLDETISWLRESDVQTFVAPKPTLSDHQLGGVAADTG